MAKKTLLEITQDILSDMNSDEVNSINDTAESLQVAGIIRSTFDNIVSGKDYPHQNTLLQLQSSGTSDRPSHMVLPEGLLTLDTLKYNVRKSTDTKDKYITIEYKEPVDFLTLTDSRVSSDTDVTTVTDLSGTSLLIKNDIAPTYYTSFDDENIVFDSYDSGVDSTLQESKTKAYGKVFPSFTFSDGFTPDLPVSLFPYLINEAKSTCFTRIKEQPDQKSEQHSITQRRKMSQEAFRLNGGVKRPNYGRQSKK